MTSEKREYSIVDGHLHVWNLKVRDGFPNKNFSHGWPDKVEDPEIYRNIPLEEAHGFTRYCGAKNVVFMPCYHDSPEEARWVYETAQEHPFLKGIVAGLDVTKHDKLRECIEEFQRNFKRPKFVGVRNIDEPRETDHFLRYARKRYIQLFIFLIILSHPSLWTIIIQGFIFREDVHTGLAILEKYGVPFDLLVRPDHLQHVPLLATKFPKLKMVIDHIAKPLKYPRNPTSADFESWKAGMSNAAKHQNVYVKLSGIISETENWSAKIYQPYIDHLLKVFGVKR